LITDSAQFKPDSIRPNALFSISVLVSTKTPFPSKWLLYGRYYIRVNVSCQIRLFFDIKKYITQQARLLVYFYPNNIEFNGNAYILAYSGIILAVLASSGNRLFLSIGRSGTGFGHTTLYRPGD
jgi:hypothetical protein